MPKKRSHTGMFVAGQDSGTEDDGNFDTTSFQLSSIFAAPPYRTTGSTLTQSGMSDGDRKDEKSITTIPLHNRFAALSDTSHAPPAFVQPSPFKPFKPPTPIVESSNQFLLPPAQQHNAIRSFFGSGPPPPGRTVASAWIGRFTPQDETAVTLRVPQRIKSGDMNGVITHGLNYITVHTGGGKLYHSELPISATIRDINVPPQHATADERKSFERYTELTLRWHTKPANGAEPAIWSSQPKTAASTHTAPNNRVHKPIESTTIKYAGINPLPVPSQPLTDGRFNPQQYVTILPSAIDFPSHPAPKDIVQRLAGQKLNGIPIAVHPPVRWMVGSIRNIPLSLSVEDFQTTISKTAPRAMIGLVRSEAGTFSSFASWITPVERVHELMQVCTDYGLALFQESPSLICNRCASTKHSTKSCTKPAVCLYCGQPGCESIGAVPRRLCPGQKWCAICHSDRHSAKQCNSATNSRKINRQTIQEIISEFKASRAPHAAHRTRTKDRRNRQRETGSNTVRPANGNAMSSTVQWGGQAPLNVSLPNPIGIENQNTFGNPTNPNPSSPDVQIAELRELVQLQAAQIKSLMDQLKSANGSIIQPPFHGLPTPNVPATVPVPTANTSPGGQERTMVQPTHDNFQTVRPRHPPPKERKEVKARERSQRGGNGSENGGGRSGYYPYQPPVTTPPPLPQPALSTPTAVFSAPQLAAMNSAIDIKFSAFMTEINQIKQMLLSSLGASNGSTSGQPPGVKSNGTSST